MMACHASIFRTGAGISGIFDDKFLLSVFAEEGDIAVGEIVEIIIRIESF